MNPRYEQYAKELVQKHGPDKARKIVADCLHIANRDFSVTLFDEAEFVINEHGRYDFAKNQDPDFAEVKDQRIKDTRNFYTLVLQILTKGQKNVTKT